MSGIVEFCERNKRKDAAAAREALWAWYHEVKAAVWTQPADVKAKYGSASIIGANRVVFDICGNRYRLVALVRYRSPGKTVGGKVYIRFIGTHAEYDKINAKEV